MIKLLTQNDWLQWKALRLEALQNSPAIFGSTFEEESLLSDQEFKNRLTKNAIFGAFVENQLVGCAGLYTLGQLKTKHRCILWGMYIQPEHRGKGIANGLVQAVIDCAKSRATQLHLSVVTTNLIAIALYEKHGFRIYGTEPKSLKSGDEFYDEHLMILDL